MCLAKRRKPESAGSWIKTLPMKLFRSFFSRGSTLWRVLARKRFPLDSQGASEERCYAHAYVEIILRQGFRVGWNPIYTHAVLREVPSLDACKECNHAHHAQTQRCRSGGLGGRSIVHHRLSYWRGGAALHLCRRVAVQFVYLCRGLRRYEDKEMAVLPCVYALNYFGGVLCLLIPDNCKTSASKKTCYETVLYKSYQEKEEHYRVATN